MPITTPDKPQATADEINAGIGAVLPNFTIFHNLILVGIYMRGSVKELAGGRKFYIPDSAAKEDQYQGKVGLVLALGPLAFKDDARNDFAGQKVEIGQWVAFRVSDGFPIDINGIHCRLMEDVHIKMRISAPDTDIIW